MAYSTQIDLENEYTAALVLELADDAATGDRTNADVVSRITRAIAKADAAIDSHLRIYYDVPLATTPDFIRDLSTGLAIRNLFNRRAQAFELPDWLVSMHADNMAMLKSIRKGELDLGVEPPPAESSAVVANTDGPDREFTTTTLKDFF